MVSNTSCLVLISFAYLRAPALVLIAALSIWDRQMIASPRLGLPEHGGCKVYEGPEFRHLRYFVAVAEECNFNRAARRLRVSQPSLSTQIRQLEEGLDAKLYTRSSAGTSLTPAGSALLPHARQMLLMREQAVQHTTLAKSGHQIPFRFGYPSLRWS